MTTIAYKNGIMACDGQTTWGETVVNTNCDKIMKYKGCLYGFCGTGYQMEIFKKIIKEEYDPNTTIHCLDGTFCLEVNKEGKAYLVYWRDGAGLTRESVPTPFAMGSGMSIALAAMKAGASAKKAVEVACELDVYSGGKITCKKL